MSEMILSGVAGLAAAIATQILVYAFDITKGRRSANHLALLLSSEFERFAERCMSSILENRNVYEETGDTFRPNTSLPMPPDLHLDDKGWESLNRPLAAQIVSFPTTIDFHAGMVSWEFMYGSPATAWVTRDDQAAMLGAKALSIAKTLRRAHDQHEPIIDWDYRDRISAEMRRIEAEASSHDVDLS